MFENIFNKDAKKSANYVILIENKEKRNKVRKG
jgi:hypothetical protein